MSGRRQLWRPGFVKNVWSHLRPNTGNFIESGLGGASTAAKRGVKSEPYETIPYASEQGIFCGLTGN
jgi:hypothetical protein